MGVLAERPADGLTNPPVGVRDKFQPAARLKLVHRAHQPEIAFLNQVEQGDAVVTIRHRDMHDEPQIGLHHLRFGVNQLALGVHPGP